MFSGAESRASADHGIPIRQLLNPSFIGRYTDFVSIDEMLAAGGIQVGSIDDEVASPDSVDDFIRHRTAFQSWTNMLHAAMVEWVTEDTDRAH